MDSWSIALLAGISCIFVLLYSVYNRSQERAKITELQSQAARDQILIRQLMDPSRTKDKALTESDSLSSQLDTVIQKLASDVERAEKFKQMAALHLESTYLGKQTIDELVTAMSGIGECNGSLLNDIEATNREFDDVLKIINEIGIKTQLINEIVLQTKILSFNASVEAARAGEHGKGFAIVAQEVGTLARQSGESAVEIENILKMGVKRVQEILQRSKERGQALIDRTSDSVAAGEQIAKRSERSYDRLIQNGLETNEVSSQFYQAAKETEGILKSFGHTA